MIHRTHSILSLLALVLVGLFSSSAEAKLKVAATIPDLAAIAAAVGGDLVEVDVLSSSRQDPHYVDPRPSLVVKLARTDLLVVNGLDLEAAWLQPLIVQSRNARINVGGEGYVDASTAVTLLQVPTQKIDRAMGDIHPGGNPHYTHDPRRAAEVARFIAARMARVDAKNADAYLASGERYAKELEDYATAVREKFAKIHAHRRKTVSYHQSLVYLYDWLGILEVVTIEPRPGIPPDPGHVSRVLTTMKSEKLGVIVQEEYYPNSVAQTLSKLTAAKLVIIPGGARFDEKQSYLDRIKATEEALYAALTS